MGIIAYIFNNSLIFIYSTSFINYLIYISTYYYRENVHFNSFVRNCIFYKTISIINLVYLLYYHPLQVNHLFICIGYLLTIISTYRLGKYYTYFGIELELLEYKKINSFPYGIIPHPMITGQIIALSNMLFIVPYFGKEFLVLAIHISLYIIHLLQEIFDIHI
jgi:hypothetical protein